MKIEIYISGKISEKPYRQLIDQYLQRLRGRISAEIISCRDSSEMEKRLRNHEYVIAFDERGTEFDSMQFSSWISSKMSSGVSSLAFCLGEANGLPPAIRKKANFFLAFSKFTLNHQLALLVFAEQLYRAVSILFNEPYHKQ
ncbi:MAG: 23S rRNA (pseudouridine(1915)-N(3))-methyltransferase RlmH [Candidatus Riflebacteria bacterium]|nr:23S rRNA (pseudouridine(1915)-N(3))-methyltransferase RlmH [Candidatus Riflebacteria bacterium]